MRADPCIVPTASLGTRTCFALSQPNEGVKFAPEAAPVRPERPDPPHHHGDDPVRPKLLGQTRTIALVLEHGLLDAAEKPATEARPHQRRPLDLEDLGRAAQPAEPHGVARPRRGNRSCHVGDPSQPLDPLMRSVQVSPQIKDLFPRRPHLDNEAMVTHACSVLRPVPYADDRWRVGLRAASRALRPRCCVLSGSSTCQQMHETSVGSLKPGRRRGRTEQDAVQNRREDPLSHATLTNPTSSPSCFRALTQPRLQAPTLLHHPTLGVPPWDSTRLIISSSAKAPGACADSGIVIAEYVTAMLAQC